MDDIVIFLKLLILLYADDTVLMTENHKDMQTLLNFFSDYCNEWKLNINVEKTKSMIIGKFRNKLNFILNDSVIENVTFYKYLGVFFHKNGKFTYCMKQLVQIAKKAVFALRKKILLLNLSIDCQLKLFDQTILPILTYACEIWGFEKLHISKGYLPSSPYIIYNGVDLFTRIILLKNSICTFSIIYTADIPSRYTIQTCSQQVGMLPIINA